MHFVLATSGAHSPGTIGRVRGSSAAGARHVADDREDADEDEQLHRIAGAARRQRPSTAATAPAGAIATAHTEP